MLCLNSLTRGRCTLKPPLLQERLKIPTEMAGVSFVQQCQVGCSFTTYSIHQLATQPRCPFQCKESEQHEPERGAARGRVGFGLGWDLRFRRPRGDWQQPWKRGTGEKMSRPLKLVWPRLKANTLIFFLCTKTIWLSQWDDKAFHLMLAYNLLVSSCHHGFLCPTFHSHIFKTKESGNFLIIGPLLTQHQPIDGTVFFISTSNSGIDRLV